MGVFEKEKPRILWGEKCTKEHEVPKKNRCIMRKFSLRIQLEILQLSSSRFGGACKPHGGLNVHPGVLLFTKDHSRIWWRKLRTALAVNMLWQRQRARQKLWHPLECQMSKGRNSFTPTTNYSHQDFPGLSQTPGRAVHFLWQLCQKQGQSGLKVSYKAQSRL